MTPSWYDVLDVDPGASAEQIRTAWRTAIADLDPSDRRFRSLNKAAEVLLDPAARAEHDAVLAAEAAIESGAEPVEVGTTPAVPTSALPPPPPPSVDVPVGPAGPAGPAGTTRTGRAVPAVPTWLLAVVGALAAALVATTAILWVRDDAQGTTVSQEQAEQAEQVAVRAIGPVLSYDYRHLDEDAAAAHTYMTSSYAKTYDQTFALVKENAPKVKAIVSASVIDSGLVRTGPDRVEVLIFVNRPTTNAKTTEPVTYKDQVTVTMVRQDGDWLIDDLSTAG